MSGRLKGRDYIHQPRRDRMYEQHVQDSYIARGKFSEPTVCPDCGAIFQTGRWQWASEPEGAQLHRCPACSRIQDHVPAGILSLSGEFFREHKDEIMRLIRHTEEQEKAEHPLERIMKIEDTDDRQQTEVSFTGIHLTKRTGEALRHAYQGIFDFSYTDRDDVVHAEWER